MSDQRRRCSWHVAGAGARSQLTDANDQVTTWATDGFGRVQTETHSDGNATRVYLKACDTSLCPDVPGAAVVQIVEQFHGAQRIAVPKLMFSDSVGHPLRSQSYAFNGAATYTEQRYDNRGRVTSTTQPDYLTNSQPALASSQEYDDLNRVTKVTTVDEGGANQTSLTEYHGLITKLTNAKGQTRTDQRNAIGQVVMVTDAIGGVTEFGYEPFGNLNLTTDPRKNVIKVEYDTLGRRTVLNDPDLGRIEYTVDPAGRVRKQTSQVQRDKSQSTVTDYDGLDRMTVRNEADLTSAWKYDTAAYGKGQLAEAYTLLAAKKDYIRTHSYDNYGRPATTVQTLSDGSYTSEVNYDAWGRVVQQKYRRGSDPVKQFDMRYSDMGYLGWIERNGQRLWSVTVQDPATRPIEAVLGNGLTQSLTYNANSARVTADQLKTAAGDLRLDQGYAYDGLGNVRQRTQYWDQSGFIENFTYDDLNRLDSSQVLGQTKQLFTYFADGSLRSKTGVGSSDYDYLAQGPDAKRPHGVKNISGRIFSYDNNGNLTSAGSLGASWTSFDMPKLIVTRGYSSAFVYGPEHQRVRQDRGDGSIIYAGAQEVETKGAVVTVRTYWPMGIGLEIDTTGKPQVLNWIHKDRLGSVVALTGQDGNMVERLAYDPWGKRRTPDGSSRADSIDGVTDYHGFTGHEMLDQLDLVHMNGRVYDPFTGKFLSADPLIQDPMNGQSYNRYSYVLNNPTNLTDPTGFCASGTEQTGTKICASQATTEVSDSEGNTKSVNTKTLMAGLRTNGFKLSSYGVVYDPKNPSQTSNANTQLAINTTPADGLNAEFTNNRGVPFRDTVPKELAEARKNNPELGRLEDQIWKESQGTLLNGFLGIGEKPKEQSLVVYINNKDGSLLYDRQYNSVFNPKTGEYSTIPLPKIVPAPEGYRLFLLEHTHPWVFSFGVSSGPVRGPSPADALWAKNNSGAYHAVQVQPPGDYPKQIYYYGPKR